MVSQPTFNFWARTFQITQLINLSWLNHPTRIGLAVVSFRIDPVKIPFILGIYLLMYLENMILNTFDGFFSITHSFQIFLRLCTVLPNGANLFARVLVGALATGLVTLGGYTFMYLAHVATEIELDTFHTATRTINALRRNLVGVIHFAPFFSNLDAHLVVVLYRGNVSLAGLAVDATACNHFIHIVFCMLSILTTENSFAQALHGGFVIVYVHCFEGAFQFVHQFWIEFAHPVGEFHADSPPASPYMPF